MKFLHSLIFLAVFALTACHTQKQVTATNTTTPKKDVTQMQGGMWIPSELEGMNEAEMRYLGSKLSASDIYDTTKPSLKDAVVQFNRGCTAEIISNKGLLLTNHHCGYAAIQSHSSIGKDYLTDGFWAQDLTSELPNSGMVVTFILRMENVTNKILQNTEGLQGAALERVLQKNRESIKKTLQLEAGQEAKIKSFSKGNEFYLIVSQDYKDIRLVGAPPSSIGKFGADTDNWVWPRHSGDFALFRIYADANNRPAEYSENNVPYKPKHFLPVAVDGVETGDFTLVFGFPGKTDEYLPSIAIKQIINDLNPEKIAIREASLAVMDKYMRGDSKIKIQYASKFARIANYWKKWIGESQGLKKSDAVGQKQKLESEFQEMVTEKGLTEYMNILADFEALYMEYLPLAQARDYYEEIVIRNVELLRLSFQIYRLEQAYHQGGATAFLKKKEELIRRSEGFYKNFNSEVDKEIFAKLMAVYYRKYPNSAMNLSNLEQAMKEKGNTTYKNTRLKTYEGLKSLLRGEDVQKILSGLNDDPLYGVGKKLSDRYFSDINPKYTAVKRKIDAVLKTYVKALRETFPEKRYFPDANSTLRVTYGQVKGYSPKDGMLYKPVSYLEGVIEKYVPGDYEFDVSQKLRDLYEAKDYGSYQSAGKLPVNFIGTNHTTGGNSGSPVLDANGNLIGLNFDRVWEGTMSDYNYDATICRNIMVDVRYILFVIDKYAGATHLIEEMQLVHSKRK